MSRVAGETWAALATVVVLVAAAGVGSAVAVGARADFERALADFSSASEEAAGLADRIAAAEDDYGVARGAAAAIAAEVPALTEVPAPYGSAKAAAALQAAAELPEEFGDFPSAPSVPAADGLSASQLADAAAALRSETGRVSDAVDAAEQKTAEVESARDGLVVALTTYLGAVADVGQGVLGSHAAASASARTTLTSALAALRVADAATAGDALDAYVAAAKAVVASADAAQSGSGRSPSWTIPDPGSITAVVNKRRPLPAGYAPKDLVIPSGIPNNNGQPVRAVVATALKKMQAAMKADGITLRIASGYRSYATQKRIYNGFVASQGVAGADTHSARPGYSEHQTGLAVDLDDGTGCVLAVCFENKPGGKWLRANAWKYGFLLRYDKDLAPIVGYSYEPWHYRYVGVDVTTDMHERGIRTLEEYFGTGAAPGY